ncbi:MAG: hypothetical protein ACK4PN_08360 [Allorhizobium sp.]
MAQPYPISRESRDEAIFFGDGGTVYGPFALKIFDAADVKVWTKAPGGTWTIATPTVAKVDPAAFFDEFTITFGSAIPSTTKVKVLSARVHERSAGVTSGTKLSPDALERELTKQGTILQELRRDVDLSVRGDPGVPGLRISDAMADNEVLMKSGDRLVPGPSVSEIQNAQGYAEAAEQRAIDADNSAQEAAGYAALARNDVVVNAFVGDGVTLDWPLTVDPGTANNMRVNISGVTQLRASYSLVYVSSVPTLRMAEAVADDIPFEVEMGSRIAVGTPATGSVTYDKMQNVTSALRLLGRKSGSAGIVQEITPDELRDLFLPVGSVVQTVSATPYTANANLSANIPLDDTIPQNTEGTEILTATITPKSTTNKLRIRFAGVAVPTKVGPSDITWAIFNGGAGAIRAGSVVASDAGYAVTLAGEVEYVPGVLTAQTISVRVGATGASTNPVRMNGSSAARLLGGAQGATLIIDEIKG